MKRRHVDDTVAVVPGQVLDSPASGGQAGTTHGDIFIWEGQARAALGGILVEAASGASVLKVPRARRRAASTALPAVRDTVTCRVTRISARLANVEILCVGDRALRDPCAGLVRREDVWPAGVGGTAAAAGAGAGGMHRCFRPGDIIVASVLSVGDARAYILSTAAVEHGVVLARSAEGVRMSPVSWCELECPVTHVREHRKVAKPHQAQDAAVQQQS